MLQNWYDYSTRKIRDFRKVKTPKISFGPGEGVASLETKHNRKMAPRPKFLVSVKKLQEQTTQPYKYVLR